MAYYKYGHFLRQEGSAEYDVVHEPGVNTPISGIYRCEGCGHSVTSIKDRPLPHQNHHKHTAAQGPIGWRLAVKSHYTGGY